MRGEREREREGGTKTLKVFLCFSCWLGAARSVVRGFGWSPQTVSEKKTALDKCKFTAAACFTHRTRAGEMMALVQRIRGIWN